MECAGHQFTASLLQMHHFLPCFRILEMDPINISSLPTQVTSRFVGRGCRSDSGGGKSFSPGSCVPLSDGPCGVLHTAACGAPDSNGAQRTATQRTVLAPWGWLPVTCGVSPNRSTITWTMAVPSPVRPGSQLQGEEGTLSQCVPP